MSRPQHTYIRPLNLRDLPQVVLLERLCFPPPEQASPLKLEYRLTVCPELCSGLFVREFDDSKLKGSELPLRSTVKRETLIGAVIGTKTNSPLVTDASMGVGEGFHSVMCENGQLKEAYLTRELRELMEKQRDESLQSDTTSNANANANANANDNANANGNATIGHDDSGSTIAIHGVIVHPEFRGRRLGSLMVKDYIQKMAQQDVAETVCLLCKESLVPFYAGLGFTDKGESQCRFAGVVWHDMVLKLEHPDDDDDDDNDNNDNDDDGSGESSNNSTVDYNNVRNL